MLNKQLLFIGTFGTLKSILGEMVVKDGRMDYSYLSEFVIIKKSLDSKLCNGVLPKVVSQSWGGPVLVGGIDRFTFKTSSADIDDMISKSDYFGFKTFEEFVEFFSDVDYICIKSFRTQYKDKTLALNIFRDNVLLAYLFAKLLNKDIIIKEEGDYNNYTKYSQEEYLKTFILNNKNLAYTFTHSSGDDMYVIFESMRFIFNSRPELPQFIFDLFNNFLSKYNFNSVKTLLDTDMRIQGREEVSANCQNLCSLQYIDFNKIKQLMRNQRIWMDDILNHLTKSNNGKTPSCHNYFIIPNSTEEVTLFAINENIKLFKKFGCSFKNLIAFLEESRNLNTYYYYRRNKYYVSIDVLRDMYKKSNISSIERDIAKIINKNALNKKLKCVLDNMKDSLYDSFNWELIDKKIIEKVYPSGVEIGKYNLTVSEDTTSMFDSLLKASFGDVNCYNSVATALLYINIAPEDDFKKGLKKLSQYMYAYINKNNTSTGNTNYFSSCIFSSALKSDTGFINEKNWQKVMDAIFEHVMSDGRILMYKKFYTFVSSCGLEQFTKTELYTNNKQWRKVMLENKLKGN